MRITIPQHKKLVFDARITIRWGDMDAMGHVNNASYFRYMETCRIDWLQSIGCAPAHAQEGVVIVNAFCSFYRQFTYPGDIVARMYVSDPARTTFETWVTMEQADQPGVICAEGGATTIWMHYANQKACTMPDWLRAIVS